MNYADLSELHFLADPVGLRDRCAKGWEADENGPAIPPLVFADDRPDITRYGPYEYIYLKYECEDAYQGLYYIAENETVSQLYTIYILYIILCISYHALHVSTYV